MSLTRRFVGAVIFAAAVSCGSAVSGHDEVAAEIDADRAIVANGSAGAGGCPEDINQDGVVDFVDLLEVFAAWGQPGGPADISGNGVVDTLDILLILIAWGPCP